MNTRKAASLLLCLGMMQAPAWAEAEQATRDNAEIWKQVEQAYDHMADMAKSQYKLWAQRDEIKAAQGYLEDLKQRLQQFEQKQDLRIDAMQNWLKSAEQRAWSVQGHARILIEAEKLRLRNQIQQAQTKRDQARTVLQLLPELDKKLLEAGIDDALIPFYAQAETLLEDERRADAAASK